MKITLDIGGSKTRGFIYGDRLERKFEILGGFGKAEDCSQILEELALGLKEQANVDVLSVDGVMVNLGGKNSEQIFTTVQSVFKNAKVSVCRESDGTTARKILEVFGADVLVMAGTGCIVFSSHNGKERVLGGWGCHLGDEGSGYYIGHTAILYALKEMDGLEIGEGLSLFTKRLLGVDEKFTFERFQYYAKNRDAVRQKLPKTREDIAALSRLIADCAKENCPLSKRVLKENAEAMAEIVLRAGKQVGVEKPVVVVNGGVTNFAQLWKEYFFQALNLEEKNVTFTNSAIDKALERMVEEL